MPELERGVEHLFKTPCSVRLGNACQKIGDHKAAIHALTYALSVRKKMSGDSHFSVVEVLVGLTHSYMSTGR